jgi:DNA-binding response OmpR family regulator
VSGAVREQTKQRILVVEDDRALARIITHNLQFEGFDVDWAEDGRSAIHFNRSRPPNLIVLDLMLPDVRGFDLFHALHQVSQAPVIILTARSQRKDKLIGLDAGADDYITKPFDLSELLARVRAVLRRVRPPASHMCLGDIAVDFIQRTVTRSGEDLHLTGHELDLLSYLAEHQERVVNRSELLRAVWGYPDEPTTRSVDFAIARLRKKLEADPHHPRFIHTVRGDGYRLTSSGESL